MKWLFLKREYIYYLLVVVMNIFLGISPRIIADEIKKLCMYYLNKVLPHSWDADI